MNIRYFEMFMSVLFLMVRLSCLAWFWGDPHMMTLDGKQYTFNGWGEYIVMKTVNDTFVLQGRTQPVNTSSATIFSAFSMAEFAPSSGFKNQTPKSDVLHVELSVAGSLTVMYRSVVSVNQSWWKDITTNFTELDNATSFDLHRVSISRPKAEGITATFPPGISVTVEAKKGLLSLVVAAPDQQRGETRGLLGVWDGNKDNELVFRNGTNLSPNATDRKIHDFGQDCKLHTFVSPRHR